LNFLKEVFAMSTYFLRNSYPLALKNAARFLKDKPHKMLEGFGARGESALTAKRRDTTASF
jgi:hypothetical protein